MTVQIQLRRSTTDQWTSTNPILAIGEPGYDTTLKQLKIGDGVTHWNDLLVVNTQVLDPTQTYFISVKDYGALGNGSADDTLAIQAALDDFATRAGTGSSIAVYFPRGTYKITKPLKVYSYTMIYGDGEGSQILTTDTTLTEMINLRPAVVNPTALGELNNLTTNTVYEILSTGTTTSAQWNTLAGTTSSWGAGTPAVGDTFTSNITTYKVIPTSVVDLVNNQLTLTAHGWTNTTQVVYSQGSGDSMTGLTNGGTYFVKVVNANTIQLSTVSGGTALDLGDVNNLGKGNDTQSLTPLVSAYGSGTVRSCYPYASQIFVRDISIKTATGSNTWAIRHTAGRALLQSNIENIVFNAKYGVSLNRYTQSCVINNIYTRSSPVEQMFVLAGNRNFVSNIDKDDSTAAGTTTDPYVLIQQASMAPESPTAVVRAGGNVVSNILIEGACLATKPALKLYKCESVAVNDVWIETGRTSVMSGVQPIIVLDDCRAVTFGGNITAISQDQTVSLINGSSATFDRVKVWNATYGNAWVSEAFVVDASSNLTIEKLVTPDGRNVYSVDASSGIRVMETEADYNSQTMSTDAKRTTRLHYATSNMLTNPTFSGGDYGWSTSVATGYTFTQEDSTISPIGNQLSVAWPSDADTFPGTGKTLHQNFAISAGSVGRPFTFTAIVQITGAASTGTVSISPWMHGAGLVGTRGVQLHQIKVYSGSDSLSSGTLPSKWFILTQTVVPTATGNMQVGVKTFGVTSFKITECSFTAGTTSAPNASAIASLDLNDRPIMMLSAPPATGTWPAGSIVFNSNPAPGATKSWHRTSAGTWESDADIPSITITGTAGNAVNTRVNLVSTGTGGTNKGVAISFQPPGLNNAVEAVQLVGYHEAGTATATAARFAVRVANSSGTLQEALHVHNTASVVVNQNLGIGGVTPGTWTNNYRVIDVNGASLFANGANNFSMGTGMLDGSNAGQTYITGNSGAAVYNQTSGTHKWLTAATGTAGNTITWSEIGRMTTDGSLLLGTTANNTTPARLVVADTSANSATNLVRLVGQNNYTLHISSQNNINSVVGSRFDFLNGSISGEISFSNLVGEFMRMGSKGGAGTPTYVSIGTLPTVYSNTFLRSLIVTNTSGTSGAAARFSSIEVDSSVRGHAKNFASSEGWTYGSSIVSGSDAGFVSGYYGPGLYGTSTGLSGNAWNQGDFGAINSGNTSYLSIPTAKVDTATSAINFNKSFTVTAASVNTESYLVATNHGLTTGTAVVYSCSSTNVNDWIWGLVRTQTYYVIVRDANSIKLAETSAAATGGTHINFFGYGSGTHTLTPTGQTAITVAVGKLAGEITAVGHGLTPGHVVTYNNGGGASIGGLTNNTTYYACTPSADKFFLMDSPMSAFNLRRPQYSLTNNGSVTAAGALTSNGGLVEYAHVGDLVWITGTLSGTATGSISPYATGGQLYRVATVNGFTGTPGTVTSVTLQTLSGGAVTLTTGTLTGLTFGMSTPIQFTSAGNDAQNFTTDNQYLFENGMSFIYNNGGGTSIGGLTHNQQYYAIVLNSNQIQVATSYDNAIATPAVPITLTGTGNDAQHLNLSNIRIYETDPFGRKSLVWKCAGRSTLGSSANDGGYQKYFGNLDPNKTYLSYVYVKRLRNDNSGTTSGSVYHGLSSANYVYYNQTGDNLNTNPYYNSMSASSLTPGVWHLMVGVLHPWNADLLNARTAKVTGYSTTTNTISVSDVRQFNRYEMVVFTQSFGNVSAVPNAVYYVHTVSSPVSNVDPSGTIIISTASDLGSTLTLTGDGTVGTNVFARLTQSAVGGIYRCDTGEKLSSYYVKCWDYKFPNSTTTIQQQRVFLNGSGRQPNVLANTKASDVLFCNPGFYEVNGLEPKINQLLGMSGRNPVVYSNAGHLVLPVTNSTPTGSRFLGIGLPTTEHVPSYPLDIQRSGGGGALTALTAYNTTAATGARQYMRRAKSNTQGTNTTVANNDEIGAIYFQGANGTDFESAAYIQATVDGAPGATGDMPGRLIFATSSDGTSTPTERMRIESNGVTVTGAITDSQLYRWINPTGGTYNQTAAGTTNNGQISGAIKIKLPTNRNNSSTMMTMRVRVQEYTVGSGSTEAGSNAEGSCKEFMITGYNYAGSTGANPAPPSWHSASVTQIDDRNATGVFLKSAPLTVRFGYDTNGTVESDCIWIGDTTTTWRFPHINIMDVTTNVGGQSSNWGTGWNVSLDTTLTGSTIERTVTPKWIVPSVPLDSTGKNALLGTTAIWTSNNSRMSIDYTGGSTLHGITLRTANSAESTALNFIQGGSDNGVGTPSQVGSIKCTTTGTAYGTTSDYRLKDNVNEMSGVEALQKVMQLKPVTYNWKSNGEPGQGFIAHELQTVVPDCVTGTKDEVNSETGDPIYQNIDTSFLIATLTAAIKQQQAIIEQLQLQIGQQCTIPLSDIESRLAALEQQGV